jgi:hypothetical protein
MKPGSRANRSALRFFCPRNHAVKHLLFSFPPNSFIPLSKISASLLPVITPDFGTIELQSKPCDKPADLLTRYRRAAPANSLKD